jgi:hypothetical protein
MDKKQSRSSSSSHKARSAIYDSPDEPDTCDPDDMEVPYALNLGGNESSDGGCSPDRNHKQKTKEPLRPGDIIEYTSPVFIAGSKQGHRRTAVLNTDPDGGTFLIGLDNGELLSPDTQIRRIAEYSRGELHAHPGVFRPIAHFSIGPQKRQLPGSVNSSVIAGLLQQVNKMRGISIRARKEVDEGLSASHRKPSGKNKKDPKAAKKDKDDSSTTSSSSLSSDSSVPLVIRSKTSQPASKDPSNKTSSLLPKAKTTTTTTSKTKYDDSDSSEFSSEDDKEGGKKFFWKSGNKKNQGTSTPRPLQGLSLSKRNGRTVKNDDNKDNKDSERKSRQHTHAHTPLDYVSTRTNVNAKPSSSLMTRYEDYTRDNKNHPKKLAPIVEVPLTTDKKDKSSQQRRRERERERQGATSTITSSSLAQKNKSKKTADMIDPAVRDTFARLTGKLPNKQLSQHESNYDSSDGDQPPANKRSLHERLTSPTGRTSKKPPPLRRPKKRNFYPSSEEEGATTVTKKRSVVLSKLKNKPTSSSTVRVDASVSLSDSNDNDAPSRTRKSQIGKSGCSIMVFSSEDEDDFHMTTTTTTRRGSKLTTNKVTSNKDVLDSSSSEDELLMTQQPKRKKTKYSSKPDYGPSHDKTDQRRGRPPTLDTTRSVLKPPPRVETILSSSEDSIDSSFRGRKKESKSRSAVAAKDSSSSKPPLKQRPFEIAALTIENTEPSRKRKSDIKALSFQSNTRGEDLTDSSSDDKAGALAVNNKKKKLGKSASTPVGRQPQKPGSTSRPRYAGICYAPDSSEDESNNARKKKSKGKSDIPATPWSTDCDIDSPPPSSTFLKNRGCSSLKRRSSTKSDQSIFEFSSQDDNVGSKPPGRGSTSGIPTPRGRRDKGKKTKQIQIYPKYDLDRSHS